VSEITLADFENEALPTLTTYAKIACLSPCSTPSGTERQDRRGDPTPRRLGSRTRASLLRGRDPPTRGRTPVLVVSVESTAPTTGTVLLYGHLDKQPPLGDWSEGLAPFAPVRRGDRVYARRRRRRRVLNLLGPARLESSKPTTFPTRVACTHRSERGERQLRPRVAPRRLGRAPGPVELLICLDSGRSLTTGCGDDLTARGRDRRGERGGPRTRRAQRCRERVVPSSFRVLRQLLDRVEDAATGEILLDE